MDEGSINKVWAQRLFKPELPQASFMITKRVASAPLEDKELASSRGKAQRYD
jgi:hypothetical protein